MSKKGSVALVRAYKVKIDSFEGPLDLLLHLVNQLEIDIYDIPVAEITEQYMEYIYAMKQIQLDIASEYLVMAATLLEIKSSTLLPTKEVEYEEDYEEDLREQLIHRLIEYRKYKEAATILQEKELEENEVYTRPAIHLQDLVKQSEPIKSDVTLYDMIYALGEMLKRKSWNAPLETTVQQEDISIEERMKEISTIIAQSNKPILFEDLFPVPTKAYIVTTLLAILQLLKANTIHCEQTGHFKPIYIMRKDLVDGD